MKATVIFDRARGKWFLLDRKGGRRKKYLLGPTNEDRSNGELAAAQINAEYRAAAASRGRVAGGSREGDDLFSAWWEEARPGLADSTRVTVEGYIRLHLRPFFGGQDLSLLTTERLKAFAGGAAENGLGQHAIQGCASVLRRVLRWAVEQRLLDRQPLDGIMATVMRAAAARGAQKGTREAFTKDEARRLIELAHPRLGDVVFMALHTGARKGELLALAWSRIEVDRRAIVFAASRWHSTVKTTKANRVRRTTISGPLLERILAMPRTHASALVNARGGPWNYDSLSTAWQRLREKAGVRPLPFHSLRHSYVSWALSSGADPLWVASQIGDRPETMLRVYSHLVPGREHSLDFLKLE